MSEADIYIISIDATTASIASFKHLLNKVEENFKHTYVLVPVLNCNLNSLLKELQAVSTGLPIIIVEDGMAIEANKIYLNPPKKNLKIFSGRFKFIEKEEVKLKSSYRSSLISLSDEYKEYETAVIIPERPNNQWTRMKFKKRYLEPSNKTIENDQSKSKNITYKVAPSVTVVKSVDQRLDLELEKKVKDLEIINHELSNLIQNTDIAVVSLDTDYQIKTFTPAVKEILGLTGNDIGDHISKIKSTINFDEHILRFEDVHRLDETFEAKICLENKGNYLLKIHQSKNLRDQVNGIIMSFTKVGQHSQAIEHTNTETSDAIIPKHDRQLELCEFMADNNRDFTILHNHNGAFEYVSSHTSEFLGYPISDLTGKHLFEFMKNEGHKTLWSKAFEKAKNGSELKNIQLKIHAKNDSVKWIEARFKPIKNNANAITEVIACYTDISDKIYFEEEVQKLSLIATQTRNSVIITDLSGRITYVNPSFVKLSEYDESFLIGKKPGDFLQGKETDPQKVKIMHDALEARIGFEVDVINYSKSGLKYWTTIICEPLKNRERQIIGFFSIQYEISEQKEYEAQIESLNEQLQSRNGKLTELNKSLEEFAYIASHDLKEPARNIKSILELIIKKSSGSLDNKLMSYMQMAASAGNKMNELIDSLLQYSRSGVLNEELQSVNISQLVGEVKFSLHELISENNAEIIVEDKIGNFNAYPIIFGRLLQNLIQNSIKYRSDHSPIITINTSENDLYYFFSVADNGIGIAEKNFDRVFKIFQKVHSEDSESHGIGLAICKKIVETHLGEIVVESQEGLGTTFHFTINKNLAI